MSLEPAKKDFTVWKGATFHTRLQLLTGDTGSPAQDLTSHTSVCTIRDPSNTATTLLTLSDVTGDIILGGISGTIDLIIDDAVTEALTWTAGLYELFLTDGTGATDILLHGTFKIKGF